MKELFKELWFVWILLALLITVMIIFHMKFSWVPFITGFIGGAIGSLISYWGTK